MVAKGLYVGGIEALAHIDALRITHVMSVLSGEDEGEGEEGDGNTDGGGGAPRRPPPLVPTERPSDGYPIVPWRVPVDDLDDADLLAHLPTAVDWLRAALRQPRARVLVHCAQGVSRSAAVAVALFMAARKERRAEEALALLKASAVPQGGADHMQPNDGFMAQLDLFGEMGWEVDERHAAYKAYKAERLAARWHAEQHGGGGGGGGAAGGGGGGGLLISDASAFARLPRCHGGVEEGEEEEEEEGEEQQQDDAPPLAPTTLYRCRRCRRLLATSRNEVPADWVRGRRTFGRLGRHTQAYAERQLQQQLEQAAGEAENNNDDDGASPTPPSSSSSSSVVFVEPMRWMRATVAGEGGDASGKLYCPRAGCPQRVGSFSWSGITSPSGAWVTPAFALQMARVDAVVVGGAGAAAASPAVAAAASSPAAAAVAGIRTPVLLPSSSAAAGLGIRAPVLLSREARPPVVPVSRRGAPGGGGGGAAAPAPPPAS
jgi:hypothetical protein